jgi:quinol monooxygenase YgiN
MTTIAENSGLVTFINTFTMAPSDQQAVVDLLVGATETTACRVPGFVSAALHRSTDGTRVTMYAQWASEAHYRQYQALLADPAVAAYVPEVLAIARYEPAMVEVVKVFAGPPWPGAD